LVLLQTKLIATQNTMHPWKAGSPSEWQ
jgi:hypothetical protein